MNSEADDKLALVKQCNAYLEWLNTPVYGVGEPDIVAPFMADVARAMLAHLTREVVVTDDMVGTAAQAYDDTSDGAVACWKAMRAALTAALQKQLR